VATAALLDTIPGTVFTVGDHAYPRGTTKEFQDCYDARWGRHKARTRPAPGNHDYLTANAKGYYDYFGDNAGPDRRGYYSYNLGAWHIVSLNSFIAADRRSPQIEWLRQDLKDNHATCTLAYWHIPDFSSGPHGSDLRTSAHMLEAWRVLYEFRADVVMRLPLVTATGRWKEPGEKDIKRMASASREPADGGVSQHLNRPEDEPLAR
jgi:hypothetical protein